MKGNYLQLLGTDLEAVLSVVIRGSDGEDGAVTIPPKALQETLKGRTGGVTIQGTSQPVGLSVSLGGGTVQINGVDAAEFPPTPPPETPVATLHTGVLLKGITQCLHGVASNYDRSVLTALCTDIWESGGMKIATADGYRLCVYETGVQEGEPVRFLVPSSSAKLLQTALKELAPEHVTVTCQRGKQEIATDVGFALLPTKTKTGIVRASLVSRVVAGSYPGYESLVSTKHDTEVIVGRNALLEAVKAAQPFANDGSGIVRLVAENKTLTVSAKAEELGSYSQDLAAEVKGKPGKIALKVKYALEALAVLSGANVSLELTAPGSPMVWRDPDDPDYLDVIMPMFVQW